MVAHPETMEELIQSAFVTARNDRGPAVAGPLWIMRLTDLLQLFSSR